jgi:hypothetical protein
MIENAKGKIKEKLIEVLENFLPLFLTYAFSSKIG